MVYIKVSSSGDVVDVSKTEQPGFIETDWELDGNLMDGRSVYRYRYINGRVTEKTAAEMDADYEQYPQYPKDDKERRIAALEEELLAAKILLGLEV